MVAPIKWYTQGVKTCLRAGCGLGAPSGTLKFMLVKATYVWDQDAHEFLSSIGANEATGTGYTAGGFTLASVTTPTDAPTNVAALKADPIPGFSVSACYGVLYVATGVAGTSPLLALVDFSEGAAVDSILTSITWNTLGIAGLRAA
jgi:hypothetical protein